MSDKVHVPGIGWWVLAGMLIPIVQAWLMQAFPDSPFMWAPLVVGVLGGLAKWIEYILRRNSGAQGVSPGETGNDTGGMAPAAMAAPEQAEKGKDEHGIAWWIFG